MGMSETPSGSKRKRYRADHDSEDLEDENLAPFNSEQEQREHTSDRESNWIIAVHGGAAQGYLSEVSEKKYRDCMKEACQLAAAALELGCSAEDAVHILTPNDDDTN